jgi:hypothetical protein
MMTPSDQEEYALRVRQAQDEINSVLRKYKVAMMPTLGIEFQNNKPASQFVLPPTMPPEIAKP